MNEGKGEAKWCGEQDYNGAGKWDRGICLRKEHEGARELTNINKRVKADLRTWEVEVKWFHKGTEDSEQPKKV